MKKSVLSSTWEITLISFILILLTGKAFGGSYILYYGAGLVNGVSYSVLAVGGILLCFAPSFLKYRSFKYLKPLSILLGMLLLDLSLAGFLFRETIHQHSWINRQIIPMACLILFGLSAFTTMAYNIIACIMRYTINQNEVHNKSEPSKASLKSM